MADKKLYCTNCGAELTPKNARRSYSKRFAANRIPFDGQYESVLSTCNPCLIKEFDKLYTIHESRQVALFYFAVAYDIPVYRDQIPKQDTGSFLNKWFQAVEPYCGSFSEATFRDGDIKRLEDLAEPIKGKSKAEDEPKGRNSWPGSKEAKEKWSDDNLSCEDWKRLEALETEQISTRPLVDNSGKAAIREYCWATLEFEKARKRRDSKRAKDWQDMAEKALKRESLLKNQASPTEKDRIAGMVEHIEKQIGGIPTIRELLDYLFTLLPEMHGYTITADAADVMFQDLINHYRENDGQLPEIERPVSQKFVDRLNEFVPPEKQTEQERKTIALIREYMRAGTFDGMDLSVIAGE